MKVCTVCHVEKPIDEFYRHVEHTDGHMGVCKPCLRARRAAHRIQRPATPRRRPDLAALLTEIAKLRFALASIERCENARCWLCEPCCRAVGLL